MESQKMTQQEFADYIKIAPATLSSIFTGRTRPTLSVVEAVKNRFPNISTDWLMFGSGPMLKEGVAEGGAEAVAGRDKSAADAMAESSGAGSATADQYAGDHGQTAEPSGAAPAKSSGTVSDTRVVEVKKCDMRQRRISEIRIFYDDQTWETFVPQR